MSGKPSFMSTSRVPRGRLTRAGPRGRGRAFETRPQSLTRGASTGEAEPRRSVRATKGQHTKSFDELELAAPKRRQTKKSKKALEKEQSQEPDEVIRCVCGATEQDEDSGEAWISCETCFVWQHNVCVGVSSFEDEIPENYWCERCRPQDHKELLEGMARGEKPWEARRKAHELEEAERKKKKGGRKAKGKRTSDPKDELDKETTRSKSKASPTPDATGPKDKKDAGPKQGKRKSREDSHDTDGKSTKLRRTSDRDSVPMTVKYTPPADLATSVTTLPGTRVGPAKALKKSLTHVITALVKKKEFEIPEEETEDTMAEKYALQIERAVFDTHPVANGNKEYSQQIKSLAFNLKNNPEICRGLMDGIHSPSTLAVMTSEQLASAELQRQTAEMRAKAEKQSILYTQDTGPRVRRTHKGEEVVEDESVINDAPIPMAGGPRRGAGAPSDHQSPIVKRESVSGETGRPPSQGGGQSPTLSNFDIKKVFSTVKSPTAAHNRRPSAPVIHTNGPGFDPDVDRMLQDETESPPYSPTEESHDPDVIWKGSLAMSSIADFPATAKHVGGANFAAFGPWSRLIPKRMTVAGRIQQQSAIEYLCSLRYSNLTDIVVVSIAPATADAQPEFNTLVDYFLSKNRYGVVGDKVAGNVRDTYLVPVPAGEDGHPEFMLNLVDNHIPATRTEPMLLAVFVYRNDPDQLRQAQEASAMQALHAAASPTPAAAAAQGQRSNSTSGPAFSPATPQGAFGQQYSPGAGAPAQSATPVPIPQPPHTTTRPGGTPHAGGAAPTPSQSPPVPAAVQQHQQQQHPHQHQHQPTEEQKVQLQKAGQAVAAEVLGPLITVPTVQFILPQAFQMSRREWEVVRSIYEREPRAREDLQYLGSLLEKESSAEQQQQQQAAAAGGGGSIGGAATAATATASAMARKAA
ncbi:tat pathway signal sequence [Purpureocillium lavendulum]|uniref:Transcription factor BYE1 n=1 Tax=Purpureocillium lavendulum TaxID=1247861 RepID=A0AB34FK28_9HYPO|nr:tat pathway signal sequence [Purpureocillium lavendulum]